jgi:hypothetical protein
LTGNWVPSTTEIDRIRHKLIFLWNIGSGWLLHTDARNRPKIRFPGSEILNRLGFRFKKILNFDESFKKSGFRFRSGPAKISIRRKYRVEMPKALGFGLWSIKKFGVWVIKN